MRQRRSNDWSKEQLLYRLGASGLEPRVSWEPRLREHFTTPFLFATRHVAAEIVRRESRRIAREQAAHLMDSEPTAAESLPWESLRPWLDEALDCLGKIDRHAVLLRFFAGRSFAEIGAELQVSEEASRKRVERALEGLRKQLDRRGVTTTAAALTAALAASPAVAAPSGLAATVATTATSAAAGGTLASGLTVFMSTVKLYSVTGAAATMAGIALLGTAAFLDVSQQQQEERTRREAHSAQVRAERVALAWLKRAPAAKITPPTATPAPARQRRPRLRPSYQPPVPTSPPPS